MNTIYVPEDALGTEPLLFPLLVVDVDVDFAKGGRRPSRTRGHSVSPFQCPVWPQSAHVERDLSIRPEVRPRPLDFPFEEPLLFPELRAVALPEALPEKPGRELFVELPL